MHFNVCPLSLSSSLISHSLTHSFVTPSLSFSISPANQYFRSLPLFSTFRPTSSQRLHSQALAYNFLATQVKKDPLRDIRKGHDLLAMAGNTEALLRISTLSIISYTSLLARSLYGGFFGGYRGEGVVVFLTKCTACRRNDDVLSNCCQNCCWQVTVRMKSKY